MSSAKINKMFGKAFFAAIVTVGATINKKMHVRIFLKLKFPFIR